MPNGSAESLVLGVRSDLAKTEKKYLSENRTLNCTSDTVNFDTNFG
jgi:hypothetical protein